MSYRSTFSIKNELELFYNIEFNEPVNLNTLQSNIQFTVNSNVSCVNHELEEFIEYILITCTTLDNNSLPIKNLVLSYRNNNPNYAKELYHLLRTDVHSYKGGYASNFYEIRLAAFLRRAHIPLYGKVNIYIKFREKVDCHLELTYEIYTGQCGSDGIPLRISVIWNSIKVALAKRIYTLECIIKESCDIPTQKLNNYVKHVEKDYAYCVFIFKQDRIIENTECIIPKYIDVYDEYIQYDGKLYIQIKDMWFLNGACCYILNDFDLMNRYDIVFNIDS